MIPDIIIDVSIIEVPVPLQSGAFGNLCLFFLLA